MNSLTLAERVAVTDKVDYLILKYLIEKREKFEYVPQSVLKENLSLTERGPDKLIEAHQERRSH